MCLMKDLSVPKISMTSNEKDLGARIESESHRGEATDMTMAFIMIRLSPICLLLLLIHGCAEALASKSATNANPPTYKKKAIIIGGGPVGLATALTLSNPPHCMNVKLFEQSTPAAYDPTKAYLYMVNGRGQVWTQRFPRVQELLVERGSAVAGGMGNFLVVPAGPEKPIPEAKPMGQQRKEVEKVVNRESYWIPRHTMTEMLEEVIREQQANYDGECGSIELCLGMRLVSMETENGGDMVKVTVQTVKDPNVRYEESYTCNFVVGADGAKSEVRGFLSYLLCDKEAQFLLTAPTHIVFFLRSAIVLPMTRRNLSRPTG